MKKFLASVGTGTLFTKVDGELKMAAHVTTLTESTLSITSTQEEVRAGQGAKLYGRFNHDAGMTVTLTDAMFDLNYIAWQVGSELQRGGIVMYTEQVTAGADGAVTLSQPVEKIGESCGLDQYLIWYRAAGCDASDDYYSQVVEAGATSINLEEGVEGTDYCVSYFTKDHAANTILVNANFVPAELVLVLTTKLFAGDASNPETGKPVGEITIKIPRFSLDGSFDLQMAMSSAATMSLNGTALAVDDGSCDSDGIYAEIVEVISSAKWYDGLTGFETELGENGSEVSISELAVDDVITVYGIFKNAAPSIIDASLLKFETTGTGVVDATGKVTTAFVAGDTLTITPADEGAPEVSYTISFVA